MGTPRSVHAPDATATRDAYARWLADEAAHSAQGVRRTWSLEVAALLLAGLDPELVPDQWDREPRSSLQGPYVLAWEISGRLTEAFARGEFAAHGVESGSPPHRRRASPEAFLRWARGEGFELPRALVRALESPEERRARIVRRAHELEAEYGSKGWRSILALEEGVSDARIGQLLREGKWVPRSKRFAPSAPAALPWR